MADKQYGTSKAICRDCKELDRMKIMVTPEYEPLTVVHASYI
jgi:hypothetical protein